MNEYSLGFQNCIEVNEKLYFPSFLGNALFCINQGEIEYLGAFPGESIEYNRKLFGDVVENNNKLYFAPMNAESIAVYDMDTGKFSQIDLFIDFVNNRSKFNTMVIHEDILYLFPTYYDGVISVNLHNGKKQKLDSWVAVVNDHAINPNDTYCGFGKVIHGDRVYVPICRSNVVLELNLLNQQILAYIVGEDGYSAIADDGENLWLISRWKNEIVKWNPDDYKIQRIYIEHPDVICKGFVGMVNVEGFLYAFPEYGNNVIKINTRTNEVTIADEFSKLCNALNNPLSVHDSAFIFAEKINNEVLLCTGKAGEVIRVNFATHKIERIYNKAPNHCHAYFEWLYNKKTSDIIAAGLYKHGGVLLENKQIGLKEYFKYYNTNNRFV